MTRLDPLSSELACPDCGTPMVRRRNRADRSEFWGCPNFPQCRRTRELSAMPAFQGRTSDATGATEIPPPDASAWRQRSVAGGSATAAFDRRTTRHQERVRTDRPWILLAGLVIVAVGLWLTTVDRWAFAGWGLVAVGVLSALARLLLAPNHVRAWSIGATGEARVGALLDGLEANGWFVLHDRRVPGARENIDHLVIGPPGVVVVETKNYAGKLRVRGGELIIGGRRQTGFLDQVERQIDAVERALGIDHATAVICVLRADFPWLSRPVARGIAIVPEPRLIGTLTSPPPRLSSAEIERLARVAEQRLRPAVRQQADPTTS